MPQKGLTLCPHSRRLVQFTFNVNEPWGAPFVSLLRGYREEIVLREGKQLDLILDAAAEAVAIGCPADVTERLTKLQDVIQRKKDLVRRRHFAHLPPDG